MIDAVALCRLRTDRGFTQRRFADTVGVSYRAIRRLEADADPGDLPLRVVERMADAVGVTASPLLADRHAVNAQQVDPPRSSAPAHPRTDAAARARSQTR